MGGELLVQVVDIARFQAIRPALDELEAARTLGLQSRVVLREAAASPFARRERYRRFAGLLGRILRHPELELRIFLAPRDLDEVVQGVVHVLCFEKRRRVQPDIACRPELRRARQCLLRVYQSQLVPCGLSRSRPRGRPGRISASRPRGATWLLGTHAGAIHFKRGPGSVSCETLDSRPRTSLPSWLRFGVKTAGLIRLDPTVYPSVLFGGAPEPKPEWVCQSPSDGGLHIRAAAKRIDVHIAQSPIARVELNAISGYSLILVMTTWLELISDLIDPERVFLGDVLLQGRKLPDWRTIRSLAQPLVRSREETLYSECPRCGERAVFPVSGQLYFEDASVTGEPVIATNAIFVREDLAHTRNLRRPHGAFKPERVVLRSTMR